ncbi:glycerophosphodiester phosphodiesterase [Alteromonas sediminis]|uniref:glycerophosphodiester phosphodiesterase n=1 Tax=Alteromonas sediminis TaxID=2259342 RepID=A0A3N5ZBR4_9ALTE|nr:glycerophosphodiester phosphodiesterase [Alteromonas sediminis]RPJ68834.1 glycerophosphodiester phosphodiesterase [Alteromonas sediminis]
MRFLSRLILPILCCSFPVFAFDIIAHRGASGYLPEHTLEAAILAHAQSPDYIEQDLVMSKDGELIVLHDIHLETVTNVEAIFPDRARDDGRWYAIDFTLEELKQLTVHERQNRQSQQVFSQRYQGDHSFSIATFSEQVALIQELNRSTGKRVGLYPEIKSPAFHKRHGIDISAAFVKHIESLGLNNASANIIVQCFDFSEIKRLRTALGLQTRLVQLLGENSWGESDTDYDWLRTSEGMATLAHYVDGIGPWYPQLFDQAMPRGDVTVNTWVKQAKEAGLSIHAYTYRQDALPENMNGTTLLNNLALAGVDGVFTDQVPPVSAWRDARPVTP